MLAKFYEEHWNDENGNPAGGVSTGTGMCISWQNGPLGRGNDRKEPNGAFVETVIAAAKSRLMFYESTKFHCDENLQAIMHLKAALDVLNERTQSREKREVEGTHGV